MLNKTAMKTLLKSLLFTLLFLCLVVAVTVYSTFDKTNAETGTAKVSPYSPKLSAKLNDDGASYTITVLILPLPIGLI